MAGVNCWGKIYIDLFGLIIKRKSFSASASVWITLKLSSCIKDPVEYVTDASFRHSIELSSITPLLIIIVEKSDNF